MSYFKSIRFRLILITIVMQTAIAVVFIVAAFYSSNRLLAENIAGITDSVGQTVTTAVEEWRASTLGFAKIMAVPSADMAEALRAMDTDRVIELSEDAFASSGADGMTITDMEGTVIARPNMPERFGDNAKTSQAIADAINGQTVAYCYATNSNGFSVAAGVPIIDPVNNEQLGSLYLSRRIDKESVMTDLKSQTACEIVLYQGDEPLLSSLGNKEETTAAFAKLSAEDLDGLDGGGTVIRKANFNGDTAEWLYIPLAGRGGEVVGTVLAINTASAGNWVMLMWAGLFCVLFIVSVPLVLRSIKGITKPLIQLEEDAKSLSHGNMSVNITKTRDDEIGNLQESMQSLRAVITGLIAELADIAEKHEAKGLTSARIEAANYEGAYAEVAGAVNSMLDGHIHSKKEILECISGIVDGDFKAPLRKFHGQEAYINDSVEGLRENIRGVVRDISDIAVKAVAGELDYTVDLSAYKGGWHLLMEELNEIMNAVNVPLKEFMRVIKAMERGDFSKRVEGDFKGQFREVEDALNISVEEVADYIEEINAVLEGMAAGDLTKDIKAEYVGQFASIKDSLNSIMNTLDSTIDEIDSAATMTLSGATQVSGSAQELARGAVEQAGSIEELSAVTNEIEEKSLENVENAKQASSLAATSKTNAETGNAEMLHLLEAMNDITKSSEKIENIIKAIEDIAFQTNLLALNAAVEAARAGDHGKGFAVVADEVRSLAARSSSAAKESTALIRESIDSVNKGRKRANETAASLSRIVENAGEVAEIVNKIYSSSADQTDMIGQISSGASQISGVVQSNSATSEEVAAASQELNAQAENLKKMLLFFKTK